MKIAPFWASIALLLSRALADPTQSVATSATSTTSAASCTASLITKLCDYPEPGPDFAVASDGRPNCWDYCNAHPPCTFVIFAAGNPYTGTGTCWLYPGQTFDASKGSSSCGNPWLSVYDKPLCSGRSPTTTAGACAASATPSAIASVCAYPAPGDCFSTCSASLGATDCLSQCAKADSCSYVVFNPHNPDNSPYASGTCWMYTNGTYNAGSATPCNGAPEQFVYNNMCPKPSPSSSSHSSSATERASGTGTAGAATGSTTSSKNSAPTGLSLTNPSALGLAVLIWQAL